MLLHDKSAVIYGGGGAIGGAIARVFAREGAHVFLAGRTRPSLDRIADPIRTSGGRVECDVVDALDRDGIDRHAASIVARAGRLDITVNAVGVAHVQGTAFTDLSIEDFEHPVTTYTRTNFLIAQAVAPHMLKQGSGVIISLSTPGARLSGAGFLGNGVASAAVEAFLRILAGELGPGGVRVVCLRPDAIPEAVTTSHTGAVFQAVADRLGITVDHMLEGRARTATLLKRLPTLDEVAEVAAFVASDRAGAMTGAIVNLTCGSLVD